MASSPNAGTIATTGTASREPKLKDCSLRTCSQGSHKGAAVTQKPPPARRPPGGGGRAAAGGRGACLHLSHLDVLAGQSGQSLEVREVGGLGGDTRHDVVLEHGGQQVSVL